MRAFQCLSILVVLACLGCPEVDPVLECDADADCHDGYLCDVSYTRICLSQCSADEDCITNSQVCDPVKSVCRTKCGENAPCTDTSYNCSVPTTDDGNPLTNEEGMCTSPASDS